MAKPKYIKSQAIKDLENLTHEWRQKQGINIPKKYYSDENAKELEKCIINYTIMRGGHAEKIQSMGRQIMKNGKAVFVPNSNTTGQADLSLIVNGKAIKVEVKCKWTGDNKQSDVQKKYQKKVEAANGIYLIIRTFADFRKWFDLYLKNHKL